VDALHPALVDAAHAARRAYLEAVRVWDRAGLGAETRMGADGTPSTRLDVLVEEAVIDAAGAHGVNVLSEEAGFIDNGSAATVVVDPVDGTANAVAGVPLSCFAGALAIDGRFTQGLVLWLHSGEHWFAAEDDSSPGLGGSGCTHLERAAVSMLRPKGANREPWWRVAERAARIRILSCSALETVLVCTGATDAFVDAGSETHRIMDLAPGVALARAAGVHITDAFGRPIELDADLTRRWSGIVAATGPLSDAIAEAVTAGAPGC